MSQPSKEERIADRIVDEMWATVEEETPNWKAPMIYAEKLWKPVMKEFWLTYFQKRKKRADNLCVFGNTDTGKTTCFDKIIPAFKRRYALHSKEIIQITCLTNMTVSGLYREILDELKWSHRANENIARLESLVRDALIAKGVQLLIIDEFSNVYNNANKAERNLVLKSLRNIPTLTKCPLIIIGTRKVLKLLKEDSETNNRYEKVEFPRFELANGKWRDLQEIIATLDAHLKVTTGISSDLCKKNRSLEKLYKRSKGKMGSLVKIYERMVRIALGESIESLTHHLIDRAVKQLNQNNRLHDEEDEKLTVTIPKGWLTS
ncbi:MAG: TniB family NTP-binding protein [Candidatus Heimdallarchaeota archaeon]